MKRRELTGGNNNPRQVEPKVIHPKVQKLGPAVRHVVEVFLGGARGVVEHDAVEVAHADHHLHGVAEGAVPRDAEGGVEGEGAPDKLSRRLEAYPSCFMGCWESVVAGLTTVMVSTETMKGSEVR